MSPEDKRSRILDKVRKLLAQAESTPYEGEADSCRERAEHLMTSYAIEVWQLKAAAERESRGGQPERRLFDFEWALNTPFRDELESLFTSILLHCRCVSVREKIDWSSRKKDGLKIPIIGLPSDLDYADVLFTTLLLQLIAQVEPQPSKELSLEENVAMLREAGLDWQEIAERMRLAGLLPARYGEPREGESRFYYKSRYHRREPNWWQRTGPKLAAAYRRYCAREERPPVRIDVKRYRKSFADGFVGTVSSRLYRLRDKTQGDDTMALVLRDIYAANRAAIFDFYPDLAPHAPDCCCVKCEQAVRAADYKPSKGVRRWEREHNRIDWAAYQSGGHAGAAAEIVSSAPKLRSRAAIGSSGL